MGKGPADCREQAHRLLCCITQNENAVRSAPPLLNENGVHFSGEQGQV